MVRTMTPSAYGGGGASGSSTDLVVASNSALVNRTRSSACLCLGLYLTNGMDDIERIPISFKSQFSGRIYRHIVLAVHHIPSMIVMSGPKRGSQ